MSSTVKLKLNESNDLKFKLHVQGTTSEPGAQNPQFRFVLTEKDKDNAIGYVFPVRKEENGQVSVVIPALEGTLQENKYYVGKMEVMMGSRYFTPSVLDIQFEKEFRITAEPLVEKQPRTPEVVTEEVTSEYVSVVSAPTVTSTPTVTKQQKPAPAVTKPIAIAKQHHPFKITAEDIKRANGNDAKLKAIIAEKVSEQIAPDTKEFKLYVESTYKKVKNALLEQQKKQPTTSQTSSTNRILESKEKIDVEDLMGILFKNKE